MDSDHGHISFVPILVTSLFFFLPLPRSVRIFLFVYPFQSFMLQLNGVHDMHFPSASRLVNC